MAYGIGEKQMRQCFDGKVHECTVLDCSIMLTGNTYRNKAAIRADGFTWWEDDKFWHKHITTEDEIEALVNKYEALGVTCTVRPNWRITDEDTNPIPIC